eukprot:Hpha_TRINITY_DN16872_c0_g2::TRINITY_DN16872_c0_g2_i2::g.149406::m.149406
MGNPLENPFWDATGFAAQMAAFPQVAAQQLAASQVAVPQQMLTVPQQLMMPPQYMLGAPVPQPMMFALQPMLVAPQQMLVAPQQMISMGQALPGFQTGPHSPEAMMPFFSPGSAGSAATGSQPTTGQHSPAAIMPFFSPGQPGSAATGSQESPCAGSACAGSAGTSQESPLQGRESPLLRFPLPGTHDELLAADTRLHLPAAAAAAESGPVSAVEGQQRNRTPSPSRAFRCKVLVLVAVPTAVDVRLLIASIAHHWPGHSVTKFVPTWGQGMAIVEVDPPIVSETRRVNINNISFQPIIAKLSNKPGVTDPPITTVVNVRLFVVSPTQDYAGSPAEERQYREMTALWSHWAEAERPVDEYLGVLFTVAGELGQKTNNTHTAFRKPLRPFRVSLQQQLPLRRAYIQLFFEYTTVQAANRARNILEGKTLWFEGVRFVIRADHAEPARVAAAWRYPNPQMGAGGEAANPHDLT